MCVVTKRNSNVLQLCWKCINNFHVFNQRRGCETLGNMTREQSAGKVASFDDLLSTKEPARETGIL